MKRIFSIASMVICIFFVIACDASFPSSIINKPALEFTLVYEEQNFRSFEDVSATVTLKNVGNKEVLVNKRLYFMTAKFPPEMIEGVLLITDDSGKQINLNGFIDIAFPEKDNFIVLYPGQSIERKLSLQNVGFSSQYFMNNEIYTVIAIYQNSLDVSQIIDGKEVKAWKGEVQSNTATFMIVP